MTIWNDFSESAKNGCGKELGVFLYVGFVTLLSGILFNIPDYLHIFMWVILVPWAVCIFVFIVVLSVYAAAGEEHVNTERADVHPRCGQEGFTEDQR